MQRYAPSLIKISKDAYSLDLFLDILNKELSMPNIPLKTMGGHVLWTTLAEANGWKLQLNMLTHHARILDDDDTRIAWGTINGVTKAFECFDELQKKY